MRGERGHRTRLRGRGAASHRRRRRAYRRAGRHAGGVELHRRRCRRRANAALEPRGVFSVSAAAARPRRRLDGHDRDDRARHDGLDARPRRADGVPADRARGGRGRDGARRRRRRDAHVPLDRRHGDAGGRRSSRARCAALAPDLRLPRPRRERRGDRAGARRGVLRARAHRRPPRLRHSAPRERAPASKPRRRTFRRSSPRERGAATDAITRSACSSRVSSGTTWPSSASAGRCPCS